MKINCECNNEEAQIRWVRGNTQPLAIPLEQEVMTENEEIRTEPYYPSESDKVTVYLVGRFKRKAFTPEIDGNVLIIHEDGTLSTGSYHVEVLVEHQDGTRNRSLWCNQVVITESNDTVLEEWDEFKQQEPQARAAIFFFAKGDKGDPFTYEDFTQEQIEDLKKPAVDAATELTDEVHALESEFTESENERVANEEQRKANEISRVNAETSREQQSVSDHTTALADHTTSVGDHTTAQSDHTTASSDHLIAQGDHSTASDDHDTATADHTQAESDSTRASTDHSTAVSDHSTASSDHTQAESDTNRAGTDHSTAADDHEMHVTDHSTASSDHSQAVLDSSQASTDHTRAESDHSTAVSDHSTASTDHTTATNDHNDATTDHQTAASDHSIADGDHTLASADHTAAVADQTQAASDHTRAENDNATATSDHSRAVGDHITAEEDHTQAVSDHSTAAADHTTAESDHAAVEVYVDSLGAFDISAYHATGGVLTKYADLAAALDSNNGGGVPQSLQKGGMSVKFVCSYDNNYVQWRLTATSFTTDTTKWVAENEDFRNEVMQEVNEAIESITPIEITGDVTNAPDEEDLTSVNQDGTDVLKFKDKAYTPLTYSGMGRVVLRKNLVNGVNTLTQDMFYKGEVGSRVPNTDTIFIIQYDYDLNGATITIPTNCVLQFDGGSLSNGTLVGNNTIISTAKGDIFYSIKIDGTWMCPSIKSDWFKDSESINCIKEIFKLCDERLYNIVEIKDGEYHAELANNESIAYITSNTTVILDGTVYIHSNSRIYRCFEIIDAENVSIYGKGTIDGGRDSHIPEDPTDPGQYGHGIHINVGSSNISVSGLHITKCCGDGISTSGSHVVFSNLDIDYCRRQGISIIQGSNIEVKSCNILYSSGSSPQCCIDIEPDAGGSTHNIVIKDCVIRGLHGICIAGGVLQENITIANNIISCAQIEGNTTTPYAIRVVSENVKNIVIENNNISCEKASKYLAIRAYKEPLTVDGVLIDYTLKDIHIRNNYIDGYVNFDAQEGTFINNTVHSSIDQQEEFDWDTSYRSHCHLGVLLKNIFVSNNNFFDSNLWFSSCIIKTNYFNIVGENSYIRSDNDTFANNCFYTNLRAKSIDNLITVFSGIRFINNYLESKNDNIRFIIKTYSTLVAGTTYICGNYKSNIKNYHYTSGFNSEIYNYIIGVLNRFNGYTDNIIYENGAASQLKNYAQDVGDICFNKEANKETFWNGTRWVDGNGFTPAKTIGTTRERPVGTAAGGVLKSANDIGYKYFDTELKKPVYASAISSINGNVTWVDALGNNVSYLVAYHLTNLTSSNLGQANIGMPYSTIFTVDEGYALPSSITVKMNGVSLTDGTDYTYNSSTGAVNILGTGGTGGVTGNLSITAIGETVI